MFILILILCLTSMVIYINFQDKYLIILTKLKISNYQVYKKSTLFCGDYYNCSKIKNRNKLKDRLNILYFLHPQPCIYHIKT